MNELQKIEFDLFICFDSICQKLNINYFLLSGSALGAVRHAGFIPWDDDLDVGMFRDDYNKFIEMAPKFLPEYMFLQNYKSDPAFPLAFSKLRNSNTTFIETALANFNMNHGIYIDIFPLDGYPNTASEQKQLKRKKRNYRRKLLCGFDMPRGLKGGALAWVLRVLGYHKKTAKILAAYEAYISKYSVKDSDIICSHGNRYGEKDYIPKDCYGEGTLLEFEGVRVRIPEKYDEYLMRLYGDWRTPPPVDERKEIHQCKHVDTKKSYQNYTHS